MSSFPLAEDTGLILPLGQWVLEEACRQAFSWINQGYPLPEISVNLSARQLSQPDFLMTLAEVLSESGLPAQQLKLELTESMIMQQGDLAVDLLQNLKGLGVKLSIDDFGTGYSSLAYLKRFPIDELKIDKSFVRDLPEDRNDAEIAATIIAMARNLGLSVVAEGVEREEQLQFLASKHCDSFQGYLYSRPLEAGSMEKLLQESKKSTAVQD